MWGGAESFSSSSFFGGPGELDQTPTLPGFFIFFVKKLVVPFVYLCPSSLDAWEDPKYHMRAKAAYR